MILFVLINFFFFGYTFYYLLVCTTTSLLYTHLYIFTHTCSHTHIHSLITCIAIFLVIFKLEFLFIRKKSTFIFITNFSFWYCNVVFGVVGLFNYLLKTRNVVVVVVYQLVITHSTRVVSRALCSFPHQTCSRLCTSTAYLFVFTPLLFCRYFHSRSS